MTDPLSGQRILITRPAHQAARLQEALSTYGATVVSIPLIRIAGLGDPEGPDPAPVQAWVEALATAPARPTGFGWLVITSANGAAQLFRGLATWGNGDASSLQPFRLAAVGPATAAKLAEHGLTVDLVPAVHTGAALADALAAQLDPGTAVTLARGNLASPLLPEKLEEAGAKVTELVVYHTVRDTAGAAAVRVELESGNIDTIVFTSPSAVASCLEALGTGAIPRLRSVQLAAIGPITAAALTKAGLTPAIVPAESTDGALAAAIAQVNRKAQR